MAASVADAVRNDGTAWFTLAGAVIGAVALTVSNFINIRSQRGQHERQLEAQREQVERQLTDQQRQLGDQQELIRTGQIAERFTRAVDQLGSHNLNVRLGGIYALERIATESRVDHTSIMELLTAFLREHSHDGNEPDSAETSEVGRPKLRADLQAVATVLARREVAHDPPSSRLDLFQVNLRGARLEGGRFQGADLRGANLRDANLRGSQLEGAFLVGAELICADLTRAHVQKADLRKARLQKAKLFGTKLQEALLNDARLAGSSLVRTELQGADLRGAKLSEAAIHGVQFDGAQSDEETTWPPGFDVEEAGIDAMELGYDVDEALEWESFLNRDRDEDV